MKNKQIAILIATILALCTTQLASSQPARRQVLPTVTWHLSGRGMPADPDGIPVAALVDTAQADIPLPNYDAGRDNAPGIVIEPDGWLEGAPEELYQLWVAPEVSVYLGGAVTLTLFTAMKSFDITKRGFMKAFLVDCLPDGSDRAVIAQVNVSRSVWDVDGTGTWIEETIDFGTPDYLVGSGRVLGVEVTVSTSSWDDMWFAYGTQTYDSRLEMTNVTINGPPTIDLDADDSSGEAGGDFAAAFVEDAGPINIADTDVVIRDLDDDFLTSLTVAISNVRNEPLEFLAADVTGTNITASYDADAAELTLTGVDSLTRYEQALRRLTYDNLDEHPNATLRDITFVAANATGQSDTATAHVSVQRVNDAPHIFAPDLQVTARDVPLVFQPSNGNAIALTDPDAGNNDVIMRIAAVNGTFTMGSTFGVSFSQGDGTADTVSTFTGDQFQISSALAGAYFQPFGGFSGTGKLYLTADDLGNRGTGPAQSDADSVVIEVTDAIDFLEIRANGIFSPGLIPGDGNQQVFDLEITSLGSAPRLLNELTVTNLAQGPGTQTELDADWTDLILTEKFSKAIMGTATFQSGVAVFKGLSAVIAPNDTLRLQIDAGAALVARDGDALDLSIKSPSDIVFDSPVAVIAAWPLNPGDLFPVDGMAAKQIVVHATLAPTIAAGSVRNLALDATLPANGYESDWLNKLNVENLGTARHGFEISAVEGWADVDDNGAFDPDVDTNLGSFSFTGSRWELTGLDSAVPRAGLRVFVTVDIAQAAAETRTVHLSLPSDADVAVGMASGNDGPIDRPVTSPSVQSIASTESVVFSSAAVGGGVVAPGANALLYDWVASNNYAAAKVLTRVTFHTATIPAGPAAPADLDAELGAIALRLDANDNGQLDDEVTDPIVASGFFSNGTVVFSGLTWNLPAGATRHMFLTCELSLHDAADGDVLAARLTGPFDVDFTDVTNVSAEWPLTTEGSPTVDGMIIAQLETFDITPLTIAPSDGPVLALDILLPGNGYRDDVLESMRIVNLGSAKPSDLSDMRMWRDGGDGVFSAGGGDDIEVGPLVWTGGLWQTPFLSELIEAAGTRVFVGITVAAAPTDSVTVNMGLPAFGIEMASGNDGPTDSGLVVSQSLLITSNPLLAYISVEPAASTLGQNITVRMVVSNVGAEAINNITPSALMPLGDAAATLISGPSPASVTLATGVVDTFTWVFSASATGTVSWRGWCEGTGATSGLSRRALEVTSNQHQIFEDANTVDVIAIESMPAFVSRGQEDIVPLTLTISLPGGAQTSDARVNAIRLRIEDAVGGGIVPADLFSKVTVSEGGVTHAEKTALETNGADINLALSTPAVVSASDPVTLALRFDVLATTVVSEFRLLISDSTSIAVEDVLSGAPVIAQLQQQSYPIASGLGHIVTPPDQLEVQAMASAAQQVGRGQQGVAALALQLDNLGIPGVTADVTVGTLPIAVVDTLGTQRNPFLIFERIQITGPLGIVAERALEPADSNVLMFGLSPLVAVPANTPVPLTVRVDVAANAPMGAYRLRLGDAALVDARDATSNQSIPVDYLTVVVEGANLTVEGNADTLMADSSPLFPSSIAAGQIDAPAMTITLRHPSAPGVGAIRVDAIMVHCQDELRDPLIVGGLLDRARLYDTGVPIADVTNIPGVGEALVLPVTGLFLAPGQSLDVELRVDILVTAPASFFELVADPVDITAVDANTGAPVQVVMESGSNAPLTSGLARVSPPATELVVELDGRMPAVLTGGDTGIDVGTLSMTNTAAAGSGAITVDHIVVRAANNGFVAKTLGTCAQQVAFYGSESMLGQSDTLSSDSTTAVVPLTPAVSIAAGETVTLDLIMNLHANIAAGGLRLGFEASDIGVLPIGGSPLQVRVEPPPGQVFPLWTQVGNPSPKTLNESYANFPNPFAAGRERTTFVYYLPSAGDVTLRIWTARGQEVTTVRSGTRRGAGLHQDDTWDGRNARGHVVYNGVYVAELVVNLENGERQRFLRKVLVVR